MKNSFPKVAFVFMQKHVMLNVTQVHHRTMASFLALTASFVSRHLFRNSIYVDGRFQDETEPYIRHKVLHEAVLKGKDLLIVGDVHGCCDEIHLIQEEAQSRTKKELITVFVGDLVNKGPKNTEVIEYMLKSKSMFSVRGNHDQKILSHYFDFCKGKLSGNDCKPWVKAFRPEHVDFLKSLPYTISIPCLNIIIVHAGLMPGKPLKDQDPNSIMNMRSIVYAQDDFHDTVCQPTNKKVPGLLWGTLWQGPEHVYFGHDAVEGIQLNKHSTGLDTGCVYGGRLTGALLHLPDIPSEHDGGVIPREIISIKPLKVYKDVGYGNKK